MPRTKGVPGLRRHKPSRQGVVTLDGKDHYLGVWPDGVKDPPPHVKIAYAREIAEWDARGRQPLPPPTPPPNDQPTSSKASSDEPARTDTADVAAPVGLTVADLCRRFLAYAEKHYRRPDGTPTNETVDFPLSLRPLRHLYGRLPVSEFSPLKLKAVREIMVNGYDHPRFGHQPPLSRKVVNQRVGRIIRAFRWGVEEEIIPETVWRALRAVRGLQEGRCSAPDHEPIPPVPWDMVKETLPHLNPYVRAMVLFQWFTGCRPDEVCGMRISQIDRSEAIWIYRPPHHKTAWKGKERFIAIGPRAQEVIGPFLLERCPRCLSLDRAYRIGWCPTSPLCGSCRDQVDEAGICGPWPRVPLRAKEKDYTVFSPREYDADRKRELRSRRKTKVQPSQRCRKKPGAKRLPGERYSSDTYGNAIERGCARAAIERWQPNQLRHAHATAVRKKFGLEGAQIALGHSRADITQVYAERNLDLARRIAEEMG